MARYMQGLNMVEAMSFLGCTHPSWYEFCAWSVERGIDLRYERIEHKARVNLGDGSVIHIGDFVVKTSGPHSRIIVVPENEFTKEYIAIVESITACEIAREFARDERARATLVHH